MKKALAFLLTLLVAATGNASLRDRLEPITTGGLEIAVDTFMIGTHDKYIVTIVRDVDDEVIRDLTSTTTEMINNYETDKLVAIEKQVLDKNSKKYSLAERSLAIKTDLQAVIASEPLINSEMIEIAPGSVQELIWNAVAGADGLGNKILSDYPAPVTLSLDKQPADEERYVSIVRNIIGGVFLDKESIKKSDEGCIAQIVEAFNFDAEVHYGGMVMQYAYQPYVDAHYAVMTSEFSFEKKGFRQSRFSIFDRDGKIIYSVKIANMMWVTEDMDPNVPFLILALRHNLPENVLELLSDDIKRFDEFVKEKIEESQKMQREAQEAQEAFERLETQERLEAQENQETPKTPENQGKTETQDEPKEDIEQASNDIK
ncbi:MAG: DUF1635 domain-containing protein [Synergistaceae bacterium]|nr:DUF1635 domain-containing protein [Synergistaceae bacterium]